MTIQRREFIAAIGSGAAVGLAGCTALSGDDGDDGGPEISGETLTLTTTTSTEDTGLLDELNAPFEDRYGVTVDTVAQGTGAALETARSGDSDVVMVHARSLEDEFIEDGYGINRRDLMFNDFVIVGGPDDPASIASSDDASEALNAIADSESTFVSRGDNSGTHTKELELWADAGIDSETHGEWYVDVGGGMGEALNRASELDAYTLSDRGTYLSMHGNITLEILVQGPVEDGPESLMNPYGIVAVNPDAHDHVNYDLALAYIGYITGPEGQEIIENYTTEDEQLFFPEALSEAPNFQQYVPEGWSASDDGGNS
ncbi:substrate-binding domain-containing protein [Natronorubrum sulfidifaciens]|uniref:Tungstate ABC transporter permease n=1 Tax=Natronorubrum sulfidifaciens JCM 14089 TaxID=1230460 RepID=L9WIE2_9EURY|nr:substrate-binding domain-containing protein [Natronorubrum sulfidifaciens]ELY48108.1 tungstate ABC transporter permease [Natronorubrum sulfidifaciens JCM 14089]